LRRVIRLLRLRVIDGRALAGRGVEQRLGAAERDGGVAQQRLGLRHLRPLGGHVRFEGAALQHIEQVSLAYFRPLGEVDFFQEGSEAGDEVHLVDRLHAAHELAGLHHRLLAGDGRAHCRRAATELGARRHGGQQGQQQGNGRGDQAGTHGQPRRGAEVPRAATGRKPQINHNSAG
jgi:hypothetical protein